MEETKEPQEERPEEAAGTTEPGPGQEPAAGGEPVVAEGVEGAATDQEPEARPVEAEPAGVQPPSPAPPAAAGLRSPLATAGAIVIVGLAAVGIFIGGFFTHVATTDDDGGGAQVQAGQQAQPTVAPEPTAVLVAPTVDDDPAQGPEDAAVTIIEFSDFQCPYCARFQAETFPQIMENYGDRIRFVYRDFPLTSIHQNAQKAAEASECAHDQGKYWEYHDLLFQNQAALDVDSLKSYAADLGLDTATFDQCLDSGEKTAEIRQDLQDGIAAGVQGTPAFYINGGLISGAQPYSVFQAAIEAALAEAGG